MRTWRVSITLGLVLVAAGASAEELPLTGISLDFSRYRLGKTKVCRLATVDRQSHDVLYDRDACIEMPGAAQRALGFSLPPARRTVKLRDGRRLATRVVLDAKQRSASGGDSGCLTTADSGRCPSGEELRLLEALSPRQGELIIFAVTPDGVERELARARGTPRNLRSIRASPDGSRIVVEYRYEKLLRNSPRESRLGVEVLGVSLEPAR